MTLTLNCIYLTIKTKHPLSLLAFTFLPLSLSLYISFPFFAILVFYLYNAKMSIAWERDRDLSCKVFTLSPSLPDHYQAAVLFSQSWAPFQLVNCCCQRQSTGPSFPPLSTGLISEQANQIWSRNVQSFCACVSVCVCVCRTQSDGGKRHGPVSSHGEHGGMIARVTLTALAE